MKTDKCVLNARDKKFLMHGHYECVKIMTLLTQQSVSATLHKHHQIISYRFQVAFSFCVYGKLIEKYYISFVFDMCCRNRPTIHAFHRIPWVKYRRVFMCMWWIVEASNYVRTRHCLVLIGRQVRPAHPFWPNAQNVTRANRNASANSEILVNHFG